MNQGEIILYQTEDGLSRVECRLVDESIWLTQKLIAELQEALESVKQLTGLLPICASCKKIRTDSGYWVQIEAYISSHSEAEFSHGICPDCIPTFERQ